MYSNSLVQTVPLSATYAICNPLSVANFSMTNIRLLVAFSNYALLDRQEKLHVYCFTISNWYPLCLKSPPSNFISLAVSSK